MEKHGVVEGEGTPPRDKEAADRDRRKAGDDLASKAAEAVRDAAGKKTPKDPR